MKKRMIGFGFILVCVLSFFLVSCETVSAEGGGEVPADLTLYNSFESFVNTYPDRTANAGGDLAAAEFIYDQLVLMGYAVELVPFQYVNEYRSGANEKSYNVIAKKPAGTPSEKTVLVATHYDNLAGYRENGTVRGGTGAYASGTSVTAFLEIASRLAAEDLPYDLELAAFGASEFNGYGTKAYLRALSAAEKERIALMVELHAAVGGEFLYFYSDEVKTLHNDLFYREGKGEALRAVPSYRQQATSIVSGILDFPYYHAGFSGDHAFFMAEGIHTVMVTSFNWSVVTQSGITEYKGKDNLLNTSNDTVPKLVDRFGGGDVGKAEIAKRINSVADSVVSALSAHDLIQVLDTSDQEKFDYTFFNGRGYTIVMVAVRVTLAGAAAVLMVVLSKKYKKKMRAQADASGTKAEEPQDPFDFSDASDAGAQKDASDDSDIFEGF